jgi:Tfp pilus assembly protein PilV
MIILMALVVFLTVFSNSSRNSAQSRNRTAAILLANSMMDEIEAHPYGAPEPKSWTTPISHPLAVWVQGRPVQMDFHLKVSYLNGSFFNVTHDNQDLMNITISWKEGAGDAQTGAAVGDNKVLTVQDPVWR